jgi:hypothetical protein
MGMLNRLADLDEQLQSLLRREMLFVTVLGYRDSFGRPKMMPAIWAV